MLNHFRNLLKTIAIRLLVNSLGYIVVNIYPLIYCVLQLEPPSCRRSNISYDKNWGL